MSGTKTATDEQLRASDPGQSVWVMANAGSGKTHVLIDRVVRLLLAGADPQSILCLTFTKAAAAEMSTRLFDRLSAWVALDDDKLMAALAGTGSIEPSPQLLARARRLFAIAIETPGGLKIQTIHAFCEKLLQLFPVESGLAPGFRVMDDGQKLVLLRQAYEAVLLEQARSGEDAGLSLLDNGSVANKDIFESLAKRFLSGASEFRGAMAGDLSLDALALALRSVAGIAQYGATPAIAEDIAAINRDDYAAAAKFFAGVPPFGSHKHDVGGDLQRVLAAENSAERQAALLALFLTSAGKERARLYTKTTFDLNPACCTWLIAQKEAMVRLFTALALAQKIDATLTLIALMRQVDRRFSEQKRERGLYDFDDLIMRTRDLLQRRSSAQWVLNKLDSGLSHILVDEAQDTSPEQWQIVTALADEFFSGEGRPREKPRTIFAVGDIKQSIYSFQGADTEAFKAARRHFKTRLGNVAQALDEVDLTISYRSVQEVLDVVDLVFAPGSAAAAGLGDDGEDRGHQAVRRGERGRVEVWPLFQPVAEEEPDHWLVPVDHVKATAPRQRLARHLADTIQSWIGRRRLASAQRAVRAGDILILLQSRNSLFEALIAELRLRHVPVTGADRLKLQDSLAIQDLLALAQFCLLPDDDFSLAAVLKSPLVPQPLSEEELFDIAYARKGSLWQAILASGKHAATVAALTDAMAQAGSGGPHAFFAAVLARRRKAVVARLGVEAQDATDVFLDQALAFEREEGTSLAAFVHWFRDREADVKRELEQGDDQVRIMTVHGAKGLEANIVILPDAADIPGPRAGSRLLATTPDGQVTVPLPFFDIPTDIETEVVEGWKRRARDKARDERKRLLYVAMTRARDELYIAGVQGRSSSGKSKQPDENSWYALIMAAIENAPAGKAPRPVEEAHPHGPLWRWGMDPVAVAAAEEPSAKPPELPAWALTPVTRRPSSRSARAVMHLAAGDSKVFDPGAAQRGRAIHRVLERLNFASPDIAGTIARRVAKEGLEPALAGRLVALVTAPEAAPFFVPEGRAEASIIGDLKGLGQVQGRVDRLVIGSETIWILDYKSGASPTAEAPEDYLRQMAQYAGVLAQAYSGRSIKAALFWTQTGSLQWLEANELSQALDRLRRERAVEAA